MRTITTTVYTISELDETAREKAREWYRTSGIIPFWQKENIESVEAIADAMNCSVSYNSYDGIDYTVRFSPDIDDVALELSGIRAWKYVWNNFIEPNLKGKYYSSPFHEVPVSKEHPAGIAHKSRHSNVIMQFSCPFTGYYMDDTLWIIWNKHKADFAGGYTVKDFIYDVASKCGEEWTDDNEGQLTDEAVDESLEINDYEFTKEGKIV